MEMKHHLILDLCVRFRMPYFNYLDACKSFGMKPISHKGYKLWWRNHVDVVWNTFYREGEGLGCLPAMIEEYNNRKFNWVR